MQPDLKQMMILLILEAVEKEHLNISIVYNSPISKDNQWFCQIYDDLKTGTVVSEMGASITEIIVKAWQKFFLVREHYTVTATEKTKLTYGLQGDEKTNK